MRFLRGLRGREATVFALLVCFVALSVPAFAQSLENKLDDAARKEEQARRKVERLEARSNTLSGRVQVLDAEAARIQAEVNALDAKLDKLNSNIAEVQADLTAAQQRLNVLAAELKQVMLKLERRTDLFTGRAVAAYMAGPTSHLEGLLSATTFNEVVDRTSYYESALDADSQIVEDIRILRAETEIKRDKVIEEEERIAAQKMKLEADRAEIAQVRQERDAVLDAQRVKVAEKESILNSVNSKKAQYERVVAALEADQSRIEALLQARLAASSGSTGPLPTGGGQLLWPTAGPLTSPYGYRTHPIFGDSRLHTGIDIGAPYGATVIASDAGVVAYVGVMSGYGNVVVVDHGGGLATTYNHLSAFSVSSGQQVGRGVPVGNVGCSGYCTGPHLHFEVRVNGSPVDPMPYLQ